MQESNLRRRLTFLASRRGMREMETVLETFLEEQAPKLDDAACLRVIKMISDTPDADLWEWITGVIPPPEEVDREVLAWLTPSSSAARRATFSENND